MRTKRQRKRLTADPFICMTDLMVALNAGLLVIGIVATVDPNEYKRFLFLKAEAVTVENELAEVRQHTQTLQYRYKALLDATAHTETTAAKPLAKPGSAPAITASTRSGSN